jgi:hypothetical protein
MKNTARQFGTALDNDDFKTAKKLLSSDCKYTIGETLLSGPEEIVSSYEQNSIEGRKKTVSLIWGKARI